MRRVYILDYERIETGSFVFNMCSIDTVKETGDETWQLRLGLGDFALSPSFLCINLNNCS